MNKGWALRAQLFAFVPALPNILPRYTFQLLLPRLNCLLYVSFHYIIHIYLARLELQEGEKQKWEREFFTF